jgi:putative transposase
MSMPRKPRIHRVNGFYNVMLRGNYRQGEQFCELLQACTQKFLCKIHLYCLMTNHIHLVIEIGDIPLSKIMQSLSSRIAQIINKSLQRSGHLFQGRYKDKIIYDEKYLLELCFNIHMNPVKAKMVGCLDDYPWSSHCVYTKKILHHGLQRAS